MNETDSWMINLEHWGIIAIYLDKNRKSWANVAIVHKTCGNSMFIDIYLNLDDLNYRYMRCTQCEVPIPTDIRTAVAIYAISQ